MEHWIEPQSLGEELVSLPGMAPPGVRHYVNRPGQLGQVSEGDAGVRHYVNRPGQLSGFVDTLKNSLFVHVLVGGVAGWFVRGWLKRR